MANSRSHLEKTLPREVDRIAAPALSVTAVRFPSVVVRPIVGCETIHVAAYPTSLKGWVHVMAMNERHALAVMENEPEPHRFDLLIRVANEHK